MPKKSKKSRKVPQPKVGQLQVWWIPQVPMDPFTVEVATPEEGAKLLKVLALYDLFQFKNKIKPDYANAGGLRVWTLNSDGEEDGWEEWQDEEGQEVREAFPDI